MGIIIWPVLVPAIDNPTAVLFRWVKNSLIAKNVAEATNPNPKPVINTLTPYKSCLY